MKRKFLGSIAVFVIAAMTAFNVNAQNTGISVIGIQAGDIDKYMPSGINLMNLEIFPLYDKTKLSVDIHNFCESTETLFVDTLIKNG